MTAEANLALVSKAALWTGRILTALAVLFLLFDGAAKVAKASFVLEVSVPLEIPARVIPGLGITLIVATLLYAIPQTSFIGAILLTGYLGGATWTHIRLGGPIFPMIFPSLMTVIIWLGLYLRELRLRGLFPIRH